MTTTRNRRPEETPAAVPTTNAIVPDPNDSPTTRAISHQKRGPKPGVHRAYVRRLMDHMCDRTFATYYRALLQFMELGDSDAHRTANRLATRPNGSFNVSRYARLADLAIIRAAMHDDPTWGSGRG